MKDYKYKYLYYVLTERSSITNGLPGIYFGQHKTNNLDDGYIGSGRLLKSYLKKHPNEFERHIVGFYNTQDELNKAEYDAIRGILHMPICLNMIDGGYGNGGNFAKVYEQNPDFNKGKNNPMYGISVKERMTERTYDNMCKKHRNYKTSDKTKQKLSSLFSGVNNPMYGKNIKDYMTKEAFEAFKEKQRITHSGKNNPAYGRKWMSNGKDKVFPTKAEFQKYLDMGYHFGQK